MVVGFFVVCNADWNTPQTFYLSQKCQIHCSKWGIGIYKGLVGCLFWPFAEMSESILKRLCCMNFTILPEDVIDMFFWSLSNSDRSGSIDLLHHGFLKVFKSNLRGRHNSTPILSTSKSNELFSLCRFWSKLCQFSHASSKHLAKNMKEAEHSSSFAYSVGWKWCLLHYTLL